MSTFPIGPYIIREQLRFDNPAWPQYLIFRGDKLIGRSFSYPDLGCCEFIERQTLARVELQRQQQQGFVMHAIAKRRQGRPTNAERAARALAEEVT